MVPDMINELHAFESDPELMNFRFSHDNMLMWPLVRNLVFSEIVNEFYGFENPYSPPLRVSLKGKLAYLAAVVTNQLTRPSKKYDYLLFGIQSTSVKIGEYWFDRINDYFYRLFPEQTLAIESSVNFSFKQPRFVSPVLYHDYIKLKAFLLGRLARISKEDASGIENFIAFLEAKLHFVLPGSFIRQLRRTLQNHARRMPVLHKAYRGVFRRYRPRFLVLDDACFGTQACILKWAKEEGIKTAEFQHGLINRSNIIFNIALPLHANSEYRAYLPDFFLSYGDYWNDLVQIPSQMVSIGNPHFEYRKSLLADKVVVKSPGKKRFLVVSQGTVTAILVQFTTELSEKVGEEAEIIYKLHPYEVGFTDRYQSLSSLPNVNVVSGGDIYECMHEADYIIATSSFTIFEALALQKRVFIFRTNNSEFYISPDLGEWFSHAGELLELIARPIPPHKEINSQSLFASDWEPRYRNFIADNIAG